MTFDGELGDLMLNNLRQPRADVFLLANTLFTYEPYMINGSYCFVLLGDISLRGLCTDTKQKEEDSSLLRNISENAKNPDPFKWHKKDGRHQFVMLNINHEVLKKY